MKMRSKILIAGLLLVVSNITKAEMDYNEYAENLVGVEVSKTPIGTITSRIIIPESDIRSLGNGVVEFKRKIRTYKEWKPSISRENETIEFDDLEQYDCVNGKLRDLDDEDGTPKSDWMRTHRNPLELEYVCIFSE